MKRIWLSLGWMIFLAVMTAQVWMNKVNHHMPNEELAPVGWVMETFQSNQGATTIYLSAVGPDYKPLTFHGGIGGIGIPPIQDYVINNPPAVMPTKGMRIKLNLNCDRYEPFPAATPNNGCRLIGWNNDSTSPPASQ